MNTKFSNVRRLIEVDLPIKRISEHARREKSLRHGNISTLHIWWARRPVAACRAVICASLWPDPADPSCPESFRVTARELMGRWSSNHLKLLQDGSYIRFAQLQKHPETLHDNEILRQALLDFIADFSNWDNSGQRDFLDTSNLLTKAAHEALGSSPGERPLVVDTFAGGGSIPLEALRVGADAFAGDLNPVAVLLNKVNIEYVNRHGRQLAEEVRTWGMWIKERAEKELSVFYPKDDDESTPIAYLWARWIQCEGPGCGAHIPLLKSLWLTKKPGRSAALKIIPNPTDKRVDFQIIHNPKINIGEGTVRRGSATCPVCGFTTPVSSVRRQLKKRRGGTNDARMFCVVLTKKAVQGRFYRLPAPLDEEAAKSAAIELERQKNLHAGALSLVPNEPTPQGGGSGAGRAFSQRNYGMDRFEDLFTGRQSLAMVTLVRLVREAGETLRRQVNSDLADAVQSCLALAIDRMADKNASLAVWNSVGEKIEHVFSRQTLPITWDFPEVGIFSDSTGNWMSHINLIANGLDFEITSKQSGTVVQASATNCPLPDDSASAFITDPPYYDAVPYADLSDFFYVWLKRSVPASLAPSFAAELSPKGDECIVDEVKNKDRQYFETTMSQAMAEGRRILRPGGVGVVVFAHKSTAGWEALIQAMISAGWTITGSWPIDTERPGRLRAQNSAALASSIHLICRPRENYDGAVQTNEVGDWREVLQELPLRIHQWMPRLANEGVVGADAIFACLGPALEIFSRYARVEKASGETVKLKEYLEHVWAAVAKEALAMIFTGADTTGFEEDARLTAMWLWTLNAGNANGAKDENANADEEGDESESSAKKARITSFVIEYDAARKIAQGLGAHLDVLGTVVEVKGETARLLPVSERARFLFAKQEEEAPRQRRKKKPQLALFDASKGETEEQNGLHGDFTLKAGETILDRLHQSMILFGAGRSEALKRFLIEDGAGRDHRFWRLAQAMAALYPSGTDERRWVEGVLARKRSLGF